MLLRVLLGMLFVLVAGCSFENEPVALLDDSIVGIWEHESSLREGGDVSSIQMYFKVTPQGYVSFERLNCHYASDGRALSKQLFSVEDMPIVRLTEKKMKVQRVPLTLKVEFQIDDWPSKTGDLNQMKLDGLVLQKKTIDTASDYKAWHCKGESS